MARILSSCTTAEKPSFSDLVTVSDRSLSLSLGSTSVIDRNETSAGDLYRDKGTSALRRWKGREISSSLAVEGIVKLREGRRDEGGHGWHCFLTFIPVQATENRPSRRVISAGTAGREGDRTDRDGVQRLTSRWENSPVLAR